MDLAPIKSSEGYDWKKSFEYITSYDWIFSTFWEKLIVSGAFIWSLYSLFRLIYGFLT